MLSKLLARRVWNFKAPENLHYIDVWTIHHSTTDPTFSKKNSIDNSVGFLHVIDRVYFILK